MKKTLALVLLVVLSISIIGAVCMREHVLTDEEVALAFVQDEYDDGNYEVIMDDDRSADDEFIGFRLFKDSKPFKHVSINREVYTSMYN